MIKCGIVGLPNVGKSTLFNAMINTSKAQVGNRPFCTIEPNIAEVSLHDPRLDYIKNIVKSQNVIKNKVAIVDIAGLVKGASKGKGKGNKFLAAIRQVGAIIHVVRCFEDFAVEHVEGSVDPMRDITIIEDELILSDMEILEKRLSDSAKKTSSDRCKILRKALDKLQQGEKIDHTICSSEDEINLLQQEGLISTKALLYVANIAEDDLKTGNIYLERLREFASKRNIDVIPTCAKLETELSELSDQEKIELMSTVGVHDTSLNQIATKAYKLLNLQAFFTAGPKEVCAWSIKCGTRAPQAAGVIHGDLERGFIKADVISYEDFVQYGGEQGARDNGKLRSEGKDYVMQEGDVVHFKFNV